MKWLLLMGHIYRYRDWGTGIYALQWLVSGQDVNMWDRYNL